MKPVIQCFGALVSSALALLLPGNSFAQSPVNAPAPKPAALRALILTGVGNHNWRETSQFLRGLLLDSGRFDVRVSEFPAGIGTKALSEFDVIVTDYPASFLGGDTEKVLETFVSSGKGLVVTRGALDLLANNREAGDPVSIRLSKLIKASANPERPAVAPFRMFDIRNALPEHPVMAGLKANLRTADQPLRGLTVQKGAETLATTDKDEPLLFASSAGKGRVFCTTLGHDLGAMQEKAFITTFLRGAEWAGTGRVTLPDEIGVPGPDTNGVRVLIITGGHDHETSFYGLFEGYKGMGWVPVADSKLAFQQDIRARYDVLVFYDFTRDLDDKGKKNLRDFVESDKGIVVLHHGILDFQKWPWWYEEVVGGLYRLERQGSIPNSTVKFGQEHWITPAGDHPITRGIGPFHVSDETYKGLFISPNIKPLLLTDNPTSDPTVAWVGPCTTSKVVFIQLGHDHSPFRHPSYRAIVHNSILWTAGKLK